MSTRSRTIQVDPRHHPMAAWGPGQLTCAALSRGKGRQRMDRLHRIVVIRMMVTQPGSSVSLGHGFAEAGHPGHDLLDHAIGEPILQQGDGGREKRLGLVD